MNDPSFTLNFFTMRTAWISFLLCLPAMALFAQDSSHSLNAVVVTATKTGVRESETGKLVTLISSQELSHYSGRSLGEVLDLQPALTITGVGEAPGTNLTLYQRGASDGYTLILIDGVVVYDASQIASHFDLNLIPVDQIDHIEILRGAASTLYGSGAVAGVINIITRKGSRSKPAWSAGVSAGSYGTYREHAGVRGGTGKMDYAISLSSVDSRGFPAAQDTTGTGHFTDDGLHSKAASLNLGYQGKGFRLNPFFRFSSDQGNLPQAAYTDALNYTYQTHFFQGGLQGDGSLGSTTLHLIYSYGYTRRNYLDDSTAINPDFYRESDISRQQDGELYLNHRFGRHMSLLAGFQELYSATDQSFLSISSFGPYSGGLSPDSAAAGLASAYVSFFLNRDTGFNLELGGRLNDHTVYGFNPTFSLNPFYAFGGGQKIFLNLASTFNAPSLYQLYSPYGSRSLKPEKGITYEGGYQSFWLGGGLMARASVFARNMQDVIAFNNVYLNFNSERDRGGELELAWLVSPGLSLSGFYTYVEGTVTAMGSGKTDTVYNGLYERPAHTFALRGSWKATPAFQVSSDLKYTGWRNDLDFSSYPATTVRLKPYLLWNLHLEESFGKHWQVFLDLENLTNSNYVQTPGYATMKFNFDGGLQLSL